MSDEIDELVDWQLANRRSVDVVTHVCRVCLARWTEGPRVCPECDTAQ